MISAHKTSPAHEEKMQFAKILVPILTEEHAGVRAFVELLQNEQHALSVGETDKLSTFAEEKGTLVARLNSLAEQRNDALTQRGFSTDRAGIEACCAQLPAESGAEKLWTEIIERVAEARDLNRLNGELIQMRMQYTSKALDILLQKDTSLDLYGPDGQSAATGSRRINDAA